jgi:integrase
MVVDAQGRIASHIELHDVAAKKRSGRTIPLHPDLMRPLRRLQKEQGAHGSVIRSERGQALRPSSVVNWFGRLYRELGFEGCTSHSGRRTFITNAARLVFKVGGSLRDVQQLAGHRSIEHTQAFSDFVTSMTAPIASGWSESPGGPCTHWKASPFHGARQ